MSKKKKLEEQFVLHRQAVKLSQIGFAEECMGCYTGAKELIIRLKDYRSHQQLNETVVLDFNKYDNDTVSAPLLQEAFDWFRDVHNLFAEINLDSYREPYVLKVTIKQLDITNTYVTDTWYPYQEPNGLGAFDNKKYKEAQLACLDKLIEIAEKRYWDKYYAKNVDEHGCCKICGASAISCSKEKSKHCDNNADYDYIEKEL